jgi:hypothetical protein
MKNIDTAEKEFLEWCDSTGVEFTEAQLEILRKYQSYWARAVAGGVTSGVYGVPLIGKPRESSVVQNSKPKPTIDTFAIYAARRNSPTKPAASSRRYAKAIDTKTIYDARRAAVKETAK